jgi:DNA-binding response OmpR family regulator
MLRVLVVDADGEDAGFLTQGLARHKYDVSRTDLRREALLAHAQADMVLMALELCCGAGHSWTSGVAVRLARLCDQTDERLHVAIFSIVRSSRHWLVISAHL